MEEICENVRGLSTRNGWDQSDSAARMVHVTAEVGEVADALISVLDATPDELDTARSALGHEIFDVIWNLCALANATGINLEQAAKTKMAFNAERSW